MDVEFLGACRGDGKIYTKIDIHLYDPSSTVTIASAASSGQVLPVSLYRFDESDDAQASLFVLVTPILNISQQITFKEIAADGHSLGSAVKYVNPFEAKWESRFNYRFKGELAESIRDFDATEYYDEPSILLEGVDIDGDRHIVNGTITYPQQMPENATLTVIDDSGKPVDTQVCLFPVSNLGSTIDSGFMLHRQPFTMRIPQGLKSFCIVLHDGSPDAIAFAVMQDYAFDALLEGHLNATLNAGNDPAYDAWFRARRVHAGGVRLESRLSANSTLLFSIIVPLYKTPINLFWEMAESVLGQSYRTFELILVNASPENAELKQAVADCANRDSRVRVVELDQNYGISGNTNRGIEIAKGQFICFFDHDDLLEPDALFEYSKAIAANPNTDLLYCDEDKVSNDSQTFFNPYFKPDFNIDLLRSFNYICHFLAIRTSLVRQLPLSTKDVDGAQDYDLTFKAVEQARHVAHVDKVLYHWRATPTSTAADSGTKNYASLGGLNAVRNHLKRVGLTGSVEEGADPFTYRVRYATEGDPLVSIIIPNKDNAETLDRCLSSIDQITEYRNFEVVVIENNSTEKQTLSYYDEMTKKYPFARLLTWDGPFNYSAINNFGAKQTKGDYLLFLNNDTQVINGDWLGNMLGICMREDVGVVGAKLYYPDDTIQHAGVVITGAGPGHLFSRFARSSKGYFNSAVNNTDLSAVTGACMMTKHSTFDKLEGFSEKLAVAFNDIDYCLRVRKQDLLVVETPFSELYHFESLSRGYEIGSEKQVRFTRELAMFQQLWPEYIALGDPYYSKNFAIGNVYCRLNHDRWWG